MGLHGCQWIAKEIHDHQRISIGIMELKHIYQWTSMHIIDLHGHPWTFFYINSFHFRENGEEHMLSQGKESATYFGMIAEH